MERQRQYPDDVYDAIIEVQIKRMSKNGKTMDDMLRYFIEASKQPLSKTLSRNDVIRVKQFEWRAEQFLRLRQNFWLDDIIVNSVATILIENAKQNDAVLDSIFIESSESRKLLDMRNYRFVYAPIFDRALSHFQLLIIDVQRNSAVFLDPNPVQKKGTKLAITALREKLVRVVPELANIADLTALYPMATQHNAFDCGLYVLSYISERCSITKAKTNYATCLSRPQLLDLVYSCISAADKSRVEEMFEKFDSSNSKLILGISSAHKLRALQISEVDAVHYAPPILHNITLVRDAAQHLQGSIWDLLKDRATEWWLPLHTFNGGNAMPKIYCAFTKDIQMLRHYVPHSTGTRPLLAYRAQSIDDFSLKSDFDSLLTRYGFTSWNYVTIVLYSGSKSGISAHRDRCQLLGYDEAQEQIASFVFGEDRKLTIIAGEQETSIDNPSGSMYLMKGVQKYSQHKKDGGAGISISVIFRQLVPFAGNQSQADALNVRVDVPWSNLHLTSQTWRPTVLDLHQDIPMRTAWMNRLHFNLSGRHRAERQAVYSQQNRIISLLSSSPTNCINDDARQILFHLPALHPRAPAFIRTKKLAVSFRVYCKTFYFSDMPKNAYLYCGQYTISRKVTLKGKPFYLLLRAQ